RNIPRGLLGLLIDQKFGLLVYSPIYALAIAGYWLILRDARLSTPDHRLSTIDSRLSPRLVALFSLATAVVFLVTSTRLYMGWGGASAPARFLVPVVPLLAPAVAVAVARLTSDLGRALVVATVVASLTIAIVAVAAPRETLLYSDPHGVAAL